MSTRTRLLPATAVLAAGLAGGAWAGTALASDATPARVAAPAAAPKTAYSYAGNVTHLVDGDTVDVTLDLGFHVSYATRLRLLGVDAPEMSTARGRAAKAWAQDWLHQHAPDGRVQIESRKAEGDADKYGRYLARVVAPDGASLTDDLLTSGNAKPYDGGKR